MKLEKKDLNKLKYRLMLKSTGVKTRLAKHLEVKNPQISHWMNTGVIPDKYIDKIEEFLKTDK